MKAQKPTKKKSISKLRKEADKVFSIWIRLKYADKYGMVECFTCGDKTHWTKIQAGHFVSRQYNSLRFDERNVHPQDIKCNIFKSGAMDAYALHLVDTYGVEILTYFAKKKREIHQFKASELEELIAKYSITMTS